MEDQSVAFDEDDEEDIINWIPSITQAKTFPISLQIPYPHIGK
jgi:hypothetical protein